MAADEAAKVEKAASKADANISKVDATASKSSTNVSSGEPTATPTRQRKKRKWDQPAEAVVSAVVSVPALLPFSGVGPFSGITMPNIYSSLGVGFSNVATSITAAQVCPTVSMVQQSAAAIVQKINQDLVNKGLLPQAKIQDEVIAREIVINDAEPGVRYKLTKRQTQEEIQMKTGAVVITRGKYKPPNGPVDHEKPLYLHISAGAHLKDTAERVKAVDQAAALVEELLKQGRQVQVPYPPATQLSSGMMSPPLTAAVFLGFEADPSLDMVSRIRGPNDQYINHIMNETGATVVLKGRVSNNLEVALTEELPQPLHLFISADNPKSLDDARRLAENLMETIRSEFIGSKFPPYLQPGVSYNLQQGSPTYQASSYPATSAVPGSYGGYYPYSLPQLSNQLPSGGSLTQPAVATAQANMLSSKAYSAVPPPNQLLVTDQSTVKNGFQCGQAGEPVKPDSVSVTNVELSSVSCSVSSIAPSTAVPALPVSATPPSLSVAYAAYPVFSMSHGTAAVPQQNLVSIGLGSGQLVAASYPQASQVQPPHSVAAPVTVTSYSAYSGIYPQATPLQQVALALQRPPPPVSTTKSSSLVLESIASRKDPKNSSQGHGVKPERRRRKFQEFPVAAKELSWADQVVAVPAKVVEHSSALDPYGKHRLAMPPPKAMPPPPPKNMPPPPPKNPSIMGSSSAVSILSSKELSPPFLKDVLSTKSTVISPSMKGMMPPPPPKTMPLPPQSKHSSLASIEGSADKGLKLVEYGEEDDDDIETPAIGRKEATPYTNGKPFWAL